MIVCNLGHMCMWKRMEGRAAERTDDLFRMEQKVKVKPARWNKQDE